MIQRSKTVSVTVLEAETPQGENYIIDMGDGSVFMQRKYVFKATDYPLATHERVIIKLCEHILRRLENDN